MNPPQAKPASECPLASGGRKPTEELQPRCDVSVLLVGDTDHAEFGRTAAALACKAHLYRATDLAAAHCLLTDGLRPDVLILAQQRPGEFEPKAIEQLRGHVPLAPVIALQSSWCEGEGRSGRPLPGVVRVSWRRFESDILPGLIQLCDGQLSGWAGPATLTPEERLLAQANEALPNSRGTIGIVSPSYEMRRLLSDACRAGGWNPIVVPVASLDGASVPCDALVCDLDELSAEAGSALATILTRCGGAPLVLLLGFAREHDVDQALSLGAAAVVSKPFSIRDLLGEIERVASRRGVVSRQQ